MQIERKFENRLFKALHFSVVQHLIKLNHALTCQLIRTRIVPESDLTTGAIQPQKKIIRTKKNRN